MDPEVVEVLQEGRQVLPTARPDHDTVAAAFERRLNAERERAAAAAVAGSSAGNNFDGNHEKRQELRRMIDPGILRPNPRHVALESLQVYFLPCVCMPIAAMTRVVFRADPVEACGEHHRASG